MWHQNRSLWLPERKLYYGFLVPGVVTSMGDGTPPALSPGSTGFVFAGAGATVDVGAGNAWVNPGNIIASDNARATNNIFAVDVASDQLVSSQHALSAVPDGATITGILVRIERHIQLIADTVVDHTVQLTKNGSDAVGNNKADTSTAWTGTDSVITYGASDDLWGTTWTAAEVKASTFGVIFRVRKSAGTVQSNNARVDAISIDVHYLS